MKKFNLTFEFDGKIHDIELTAEQLGLMYAYNTISGYMDVGDKYAPLADLFRERNKITREDMDKILDETDIQIVIDGKKYRIVPIFFDASLEIWDLEDEEIVEESDFIITEKND